MDVLIKLSCNEKKFSAIQYRWVSWKLYKQLKHQLELKTPSIKIDINSSMRFTINMERITDERILSVVREKGVEYFSSGIIQIEGVDDKSTIYIGKSPINDQIVDLTSIELYNDMWSQKLDIKMLTRYPKLEKLILKGFDITETTDFLHEFPELKSLGLSITIKRGTKELPLLKEIISIPGSSKFWLPGDIEKQKNLERLIWISSDEYEVDLTQLPKLKFYSDKGFRKSHFESTATDYNYYYKTVGLSSMIQLAESKPHIYTVTMNNEIVYRKYVRDPDEPVD